MERLNAGWNLKDALTIPAKGKRIYKDLDGIEYTSLRELSEKYHISKDVLSKLLKEGKPFKSALKQLIKEKEKIKKERERIKVWDHKGNGYTSNNKMYKHYNISKQLFRYRKAIGMSLEDALTTPVSESKSIGETLVSKRLQDLGLSFSQNARISTNLNIKEFERLTADFIVEGKAIIEFDGEEHFSPWRKQNPKNQKQDFKKVRGRDLKKNELCEKYKIPLLRIKYNQTRRLNELIDDFIKHPKKYTKKHNKFLTNKTYWEK